MNISSDKKELGDAVSVVARFAERRSATLPALSGISLLADDKGIHLRATNLETSIDLKVEGAVKKPGVVTLPAAVFREICSSFGATGPVTLDCSGDTLTISSGSAKSTIKTLSSEDFPTFSAPESAGMSFSLPGTTLKALIGAVAPYASPSTVRPELASVFLSAEGGVVKAVATDSFRLAEKKVSVSGTVKPFTLLIPAKNALDIIQALPDDDVSVAADEHQCAFSWSTGTAITRLVAMSYPDYMQIVPKSFVAEATMLRKDFEAGLRRTAIFSDSFQKVRVAFDNKDKKVLLSAKNTDVGDSNETVPASLTGEAVELSFNHRYLQAPLPAMTSESITLSASGIGRALVMKGVGDTSFMYLVMPMNQ